MAMTCMRIRRVGQAAELGALAEVHARVVGFDLPRGVEAGAGVTLAVERRDPERVDDVAGGDEQLDLFAGRDDHLTRGDDVGGRHDCGDRPAISASTSSWK